MHSVVQSFFGLSSAPFAKDLSATELWLDPSRQAAIDRLVAAVTGRRHCLVRGESGAGKNCVVRGLVGRLPEAHFRLVYIST